MSWGGRILLGIVWDLPELNLYSSSKAERATPFAACCGGLQLLELVTHHSTVAPAPAGCCVNMYRATATQTVFSKLKCAERTGHVSLPLAAGRA